MTKKRIIPSLNSPLGDWCIYASRAEAEIERLRAVLTHVEAIMTIVRPRSDMAEYLATLKEIREALGRNANDPSSIAKFPALPINPEDEAVVDDLMRRRLQVEPEGKPDQ